MEPSKRLGSWGEVIGLLVASGLVGLQVAFIVGDQLAKVWPWAETVEGRALVLGLGWLLLIAWVLRK